MPTSCSPETALIARLQQFRDGQSGATLIEYAFIVVIIAFSAVASLSNFAPIFMNFAHAVANAF